MLTKENAMYARTAYRDAANKRKQIGILAQMLLCTKEEVLEALGLACEKDAPTKTGPAGSRHDAWAATIREQVKNAVLSQGITCREAAERYNVPASTVYGWVRDKGRRG